MPCDGCALCYMDTQKTISAMVVGLFEMLLLLLSMMPFWNSGFNICSTQFIIALTFVIMLVMDAFVLFRKSSMKKSGVQDEGHRGS